MSIIARASVPVRNRLDDGATVRLSAAQVSRASNARGAGYPHGLIEGAARGLGFGAQAPANTVPRTGYAQGVIEGQARAAGFEARTAPSSPLTQAEVAELLDGDGPAPADFDPEVVAALRRIARYYNGRGPVEGGR